MLYLQRCRRQTTYTAQPPRLQSPYMATGFDFFMLYRSLAETTTNLGVGLLHLGSVNFCPSVGPIWVRARSCIRDREFLFVV
ncbi:hypothetical protein BDA96_04G283800 [Sorghum bicolor]|uniref:Uncharacterized protein n=2 Tax=Sorghum bicolor TaxID=4558 RepID=A0A921R7B1_SORBI|nr:hypothetical protein BDA96_06G152200 [Sorghum bicolor]KAG0534483.1 hypothetical protein BDA96_04G283800 [Sorghum bicolor]OQU87130.1 hypothetical protein SORBI_3003G211266 [Sorghum bicolor]